MSDDPFAQPHVDAAIPATGGSVRLVSASGGLEAAWLHVLDENGRRVAFDHATNYYHAAPVRLTPSDARALAAALARYADTHRESDQ